MAKKVKVTVEQLANLPETLHPDETKRECARRISKLGGSLHKSIYADRKHPDLTKHKGTMIAGSEVYMQQSMFVDESDEMEHSVGLHYSSATDPYRDTCFAYITCQDPVGGGDPVTYYLDADTCRWLATQLPILARNLDGHEEQYQNYYGDK
jgi:hypothetical protein